MDTATKSAIANILSDMAVRHGVSIEKPMPVRRYMAMKVNGPVLENAISIWDGMITFYTDNLRLIEELRQKGYKAPLSPCKPERPSDKYRYELTGLTECKMAEDEESLVKVLHATSTFVASYKTNSSSSHQLVVKRPRPTKSHLVTVHQSEEP